MSRLTSWIRFLPVALLLTSTAMALKTRDRVEILPLHPQLSAFPMRIGEWQGTPLSLDTDEQKVLGPGEFLLRDYRRSDTATPVNLFIAFFPSQRSGDVIHSPKNCLPGAGWSAIESAHVPFRKNDETVISINRFVVSKGMSHALVFYWYQAHGRVTPSEYWAKLYLIEDAIKMHRTDGALVRIVTPILGKDSKEVTQVEALNFAREVLPLLDSYIPR